MGWRRQKKAGGEWLKNEDWEITTKNKTNFTQPAWV